jgi:pimeloyl-ACP methyl ester carboxylesterase
MFYTAIVGLLATAATALPTSESSAHFRKRQYGVNETVSNFMDIPSSTELQWTPCYERFHCANLEVPLDYENPSVGTTVVAWIRQQAANGTGQDLLFNPGGPGSSGIDFILGGYGDTMMEFSGGKYNVVSFDPRGVNASAIDLTCFPDEETRDNYQPPVYDTDADTFASGMASNKFCSDFNENTTVRYASTVAVVQDLIHFTELQAALNGEKPEEALLYYYGVSYGTVIGQTLAALFPDRIGRIIVDSNVDSEKHYSGLEDTSVSATDDSLRYFFSVCAEAGKVKCKFARNSSSAEEIEDRFNAMVEKLEQEPISYSDVASGVFGILTYTNVLNSLFHWLYSPTASFPIVASALAAVEDRNATAWFIATARVPTDNSGPFNYTEVASQLALRLITGLDSAGRSPLKTVDDYQKTIAVFEESSHWFGKDYARTNALITPGFSLSPPESQIFSGKFLYNHHACVVHAANKFRLQANQNQEPNPLRQQHCRSHHAARQRKTHVHIL